MPWLLILWIHLIAAVTWIGGMVIVTLVIVPVLSSRDPSQRAELLQAVGERFSMVVWACIIVLLMTGILNLMHLAIPFDVLFTTRLGKLLIVKWSLLAGMIGLSIYHD